MEKINYTKSLEFVKEKHKGQVRAGDVPAWFHLARVSNLLEHVLGITKEGSFDERQTIFISALGHDVIEDTNVTEKEVRNVFGNNGLKLIKGMTNQFGDDNVGPYVRSITRSLEEVRLIKLSDLYDNITSVIYNLHVLGLKWTKSYFLPIVTPMRKAIVKTRFRKFKKTGKLLISMVNSSADLLESEIKRYARDKKLSVYSKKF